MNAFKKALITTAAISSAALINACSDSSSETEISKKEIVRSVGSVGIIHHNGLANVLLKEVGVDIIAMQHYISRRVIGRIVPVGIVGVVVGDDIAVGSCLEEDAVAQMLKNIVLGAGIAGR